MPISLFGGGGGVHVQNNMKKKMASSILKLDRYNSGPHFEAQVCKTYQLMESIVPRLFYIERPVHVEVN